MNLTLAVVEEAEDFKAKAEDITDAVEESDLVDVAGVDMVVEMEEAETICALEKMRKWCNVMTDHSWKFTRIMISLTMNGKVYLRHRE